MTWPGITPEPTTTDAPARPEPVLNAARLGGLIAAAVVAIGAVVTLVLAGRWTDIDALGTTLGAAIAAVFALAAYLAPVWQARKARAQVTPLADPQNAAGQPLVDAGTTLIVGEADVQVILPTGRPAQQRGVADHGEDGPRSEAARQAALNDPGESPQG